MVQGFRFYLVLMLLGMTLRVYSAEYPNTGYPLQQYALPYPVAPAAFYGAPIASYSVPPMQQASKLEADAQEFAYQDGDDLRMFHHGWHYIKRYTTANDGITHIVFQNDQESMITLHFDKQYVSELRLTSDLYLYITPYDCFFKTTKSVQKTTEPFYVVVHYAQQPRVIHYLLFEPEVASDVAVYGPFIIQDGVVQKVEPVSVSPLVDISRQTASPFTPVVAVQQETAVASPSNQEAQQVAVLLEQTQVQQHEQEAFPLLPKREPTRTSTVLIPKYTSKNKGAPSSVPLVMPVQVDRTRVKTSREQGIPAPKIGRRAPQKPPKGSGIVPSASSAPLVYLPKQREIRPHSLAISLSSAPEIDSAALVAAAVAQAAISGLPDTTKKKQTQKKEIPQEILERQIVEALLDATTSDSMKKLLKQLPENSYVRPAAQLFIDIRKCSDASCDCKKRVISLPAQLVDVSPNEIDAIMFSLYYQLCEKHPHQKDAVEDAVRILKYRFCGESDQGIQRIRNAFQDMFPTLTPCVPLSVESSSRVTTRTTKAKPSPSRVPEQQKKSGKQAELEKVLRQLANNKSNDFEKTVAKFKYFRHWIVYIGALTEALIDLPAYRNREQILKMIDTATKCISDNKNLSSDDKALYERLALIGLLEALVVSDYFENDNTDIMDSYLAYTIEIAHNKGSNFFRSRMKALFEQAFINHDEGDVERIRAALALSITRVFQQRDIHFATYNDKPQESTYQKALEEALFVHTLMVRIVYTGAAVVVAGSTVINKTIGALTTVMGWLKK